MLPVVSKETVESTAQSITEDSLGLNETIKVMHAENPDLLQTMFSMMKQGEQICGNGWRDGFKAGVLTLYALLHRQAEADEMEQGDGEK